MCMKTEDLKGSQKYLQGDTLCIKEISETQQQTEMMTLNYTEGCRKKPDK